MRCHAEMHTSTTQRRVVRLRAGAVQARGLSRDQEGWALLQYPNGELLDVPRWLYIACGHLPPFDELPVARPKA